MNIEKLKSGNYRSKVFIGRDKNGKQIFKSFTAPTKKELMFIVSKFNTERHDLSTNTLNAACMKLIEFKSETLSPTTIKTYRMYVRTRFKDLQQIEIRKLTRDDIQEELDKEKLISGNRNGTLPTPKYLKNMLAFFLQACKYEDRGFNLSLDDFKIGKMPKQEYHCPTPEEMRKVLDLVKGTEIELPILLSSRMSLRTSEIRGLRWDDIQDGMLHIQRAKVLKDNIKEPKTKRSDRWIPIVPEVQAIFDSMPKTNEEIFPYSQTYIYQRLNRLLKRNGMESIKPHSFRHYFATSGLAAGIDSRILEEIGGWEINSPIMRTNYQNVWKDTLKDAMKRMSQLTDSTIVSTKK